MAFRSSSQSGTLPNRSVKSTEGNNLRNIESHDTECSSIIKIEVEQSHEAGPCTSSRRRDSRRYKVINPDTSQKVIAAHFSEHLIKPGRQGNERRALNTTEKLLGTSSAFAVSMDKARKDAQEGLLRAIFYLKMYTDTSPDQINMLEQLIDYIVSSTIDMDSSQFEAKEDNKNDPECLAGHDVTAVQGDGIDPIGCDELEHESDHEQDLDDEDVIGMFVSIKTDAVGVTPSTEINSTSQNKPKAAPRPRRKAAKAAKEQNCDASAVVEKKKRGRPSTFTPGPCNVCGRFFNKRRSLEYHMAIHTGDKSLLCIICGNRFRQHSTLASHMRIIHAGEKPHKCSQCPKTFMAPCHLKNHMKTHDEGEKRFMCEECDASFYFLHALKRHMKRHSTDKPYKCEVCGKGFAYSWNIKDHMKTHNKEDRPYSCTMCGQTFAYAHSVKEHMRRHTGEKPYPCDVCGKRFAVSGALRKHSRIHTGERPYVCDVCGRGFTWARSLLKHKNSHERQEAKSLQSTSQSTDLGLTQA